jgi:hypothetical protein
MPVVLRRRGRAAAVAAGLGILDAFLFLLIGFLRNPAERAAAVVVLGVLLYGTAGTALARVEAGPAGVVLRNGWRVRKVSWDVVRKISPPSEDPVSRTLGIVLLGGKRLRCAAVAPLPWEAADSPAQRRLYADLDACFTRRS